MSLDMKKREVSMAGFSDGLDGIDKHGEQPDDMLKAYQEAHKAGERQARRVSRDGRRFEKMQERMHKKKAAAQVKEDQRKAKKKPPIEEGLSPS